MFKSQLEPSPENYETTAIFVENIFDTVKKAKAAKAAAAAKSLAESKLMPSYDYSFAALSSPTKKKKPRKNAKKNTKVKKPSTPKKKTAVRKPRALKDFEKRKKTSPSKTPRKYTKRVRKAPVPTDIDDEEAAFILSSISQRSFDSFYSRLNSGENNKIDIPIDISSPSAQPLSSTTDPKSLAYYVMLDHNYWTVKPAKPENPENADPTETNLVQTPQESISVQPNDFKTSQESSVSISVQPNDFKTSQESAVAVSVQREDFKTLQESSLISVQRDDFKTEDVKNTAGDMCNIISDSLQTDIKEKEVNNNKIDNGRMEQDIPVKKRWLRQATSDIKAPPKKRKKMEKAALEALERTENVEMKEERIKDDMKTLDKEEDVAEENIDKKFEDVQSHQSPQLNVKSESESEPITVKVEEKEAEKPAEENESEQPQLKMETKIPEAEDLPKNLIEEKLPNNLIKEELPNNLIKEELQNNFIKEELTKNLIKEEQIDEDRSSDKIKVDEGEMEKPNFDVITSPADETEKEVKDEVKAEEQENNLDAMTIESPSQESDSEDDMKTWDAVMEFHRLQLKELEQKNKRFSDSTIKISPEPKALPVNSEPCVSSELQSRISLFENSDPRKTLKTSLSLETGSASLQSPFKRSISEISYSDTRSNRWIGSNVSTAQFNPTSLPFASFNSESIQYQRNESPYTNYNSYRLQKASWTNTKTETSEPAWENQISTNATNNFPVKRCLTYSGINDTAIRNLKPDETNGTVQKPTFTPSPSLIKTKTSICDPRLNPALAQETRKEENVLPKKKLSLDQYRKRVSLTSISTPSASEETTSILSTPAYDPTIFDIAAAATAV